MTELTAMHTELRAMRTELATVLAAVRDISAKQQEHDRTLQAITAKLDEIYTLVIIGP